MTTIGVISDTHGLLRSEAVEALRGSEAIIHAGDVGDPDILATLGEIAPLAFLAAILRGQKLQKILTKRSLSSRRRS